MDARATLPILTVLAFGLVSCGRFGAGCGMKNDEREPSARARFDDLHGKSSREGRWRALRSDRAADQELETRIRQLEALGYASGTKTAPGLVGVTVHESSKVEPGLNFFTSGHAAEAVLMRMDGKVLHRWSRGFWDIWPDDDADPVWEGTQHWRRAQPLANGDILVIFEGLGLAKLDKDSKILWARRNGAHHDLQVLANGDIAVLARTRRLIPRIHEHWPILEDFVLILDAKGRELERYSILEAFERSDEFRQTWDDVARWKGDLFHTNSVRVLDGRFAHLNPAFASGNFLLSSRHLSAVFVVDPRVNEVVWFMQGAFKAQHDAELLDDGLLMLFDNQGKGEVSSVRVYDPATRALQWEYAGTDSSPFFSSLCGASQRLDNGNTLITESENGRAFEVTPEGEIVWEFYNPHRAGADDEFIATLFHVDRIPRALTSWRGSE